MFPKLFVNCFIKTMDYFKKKSIIYQSFESHQQVLEDGNDVLWPKQEIAFISCF
jgi:hypothetical protein